MHRRNSMFRRPGDSSSVCSRVHQQIEVVNMHDFLLMETLWQIANGVHLWLRLCW
ncbi:hypothetical protein HanRHA438_Chr07g0312781 [Helianthus annuus]|nr:hypothetical protein HanRHA438_Chr07g0312781 [Helianthus annuus]